MKVAFVHRFVFCLFLVLLVPGCVGRLDAQARGRVLDLPRQQCLVVSKENFIASAHSYSSEELRDPLRFVEVQAGKLGIDGYGEIESDGFYIMEKELTVGQFYDLVSCFLPVDRKGFAEWRVAKMSTDFLGTPANTIDYFLSDDVPMIGVSRDDVSLLCLGLSVACDVEFDVPTFGEYLYAREWALRSVVPENAGGQDLLMLSAEPDTESVLQEIMARWPVDAFVLSSLFDGPPEYLKMDPVEDIPMALRFLDREGVDLPGPYLYRHADLMAGPASFLGLAFLGKTWRDHDVLTCLTARFLVGQQRFGISGFDVGMRLVLRDESRMRKR